MRSAYIDIGYNAIRAVVYEDKKLGSAEIFSDKFRSDILSLLELDNMEVKHQSYLSLQYLSHIFKQLLVTDIKCVATAVLRGHPKALQFKEIVKTKFDIDINILSGEEEAYLTAMGLISGISHAKGVAADLGGGSLELASIFDRTVGTIKSLALGTKVISKNNMADIGLIKEIIIQEFGTETFPNLYLIGGALRFIGRFYMEFIRYPLKNLHNLEIPAVDFQIYLEKLDHISKIKPTYEIRADQNAVLVAKAMVELFKPEKVIISNYGLKEGVRFVSLEQEEQDKDIIFERIKDLLMVNIRDCNLDQYQEALNKLLINPDAITYNIVKYSIMLCQFNKNIDKTLKANFAVDFVLSCDIPFSHRERVMTAISLSSAYIGKIDSHINKLAKKILTKKDYFNSQIIGNFIRIARVIDGPEFSSPTFTLQLKENYIEIVTKEILPHQIFEKICDRLREMAYARKMARNHSN